MNDLYCEKETEIIAAMRSGGLRPELERHSSACDICSGVVAVSEFLRQQAAVQPVVPDSDFLWWKAQLASRRLAVERATRSIVLVRRLAYSGIGAAPLWLWFTRGHLGLLPAGLPGHDFWLSSALGQTALCMGVGALVFTFLSSWYLARFEK